MLIFSVSCPPVGGCEIRFIFGPLFQYSLSMITPYLINISSWTPADGASSKMIGMNSWNQNTQQNHTEQPRPAAQFFGCPCHLGVLATDLKMLCCVCEKCATFIQVRSELNTNVLHGATLRLFPPTISSKC